MKTIIELIQSLFKELTSLFTETKQRERVQKEFFYAIFYHWNALKLSLKTKLNKSYIIAGLTTLAIFVLLELFLQPHKAAILDKVTLWLNPILDDTDKTIDSNSSSTNGFLGIGISLFIASVKDYYRSFFSRESIEYILFFEAYKFALITLAKPALENLTDRIQYIYSDGKIIPQRKGIWANYKHSFQLALYSLSLQLLLAMVLFPFAPISTFLISWYFTGLMLMDGYTRSNGTTAKESLHKIWDHKWFAIGIGFMFTALNFIPYIGPVLAPVLSSVASAIGLYELEKAQSTTENKEEISDKDKAYYAVEKQTENFSKDFNEGIDITNAFDFIRTKKIKTKNGTGLNLLIVSGIWITIWYFIFNYTRTSAMLSYLFPLYKPEFDDTDGLSVAVSAFSSTLHFFTVFTVLCLFGFTFYRFLVFLFHTNKIYTNSLLIQNANEPNLNPDKINRGKLFFNNFLLMVIEMFMIWILVYIFLATFAYTLLISLVLFFVIDIILIGSIMIVSRDSFDGLSLSQKIKILWQHKGFVLGTGLVYLLGSYVPFAALRYTPSLTVTIVELAIPKIKLGQTIQYIKSKQITSTKNG